MKGHDQHDSIHNTLNYINLSSDWLIRTMNLSQTLKQWQ